MGFSFSRVDSHSSQNSRAARRSRTTARAAAYFRLRVLTSRLISLRVMVFSSGLVCWLGEMGGSAGLWASGENRVFPLISAHFRSFPLISAHFRSFWLCWALVLVGEKTCFSAHFRSFWLW